MDDQADELFGPIPETVEPAPIEQAPVDEAPPAPTPEPAPPEPPRDEGGRTVPLDALQEERRKRQDLERRFAEMEARTNPQPAQQFVPPDPFDDPAGYDAHVQQIIAQKEQALTWSVSDRFARREHGKDTVEAALTWAAQRAQAGDQGFIASYMGEQDPVDWIVRQHKRDGLLSQIGDVNSVDDWFAQEAAKRGYAPTPAPAAVVPTQVAATTQQAPKPAVPPRSLVREPSAGGVTHTPLGTQAALEAVFPK